MARIIVRFETDFGVEIKKGENDAIQLYDDRKEDQYERGPAEIDLKNQDEVVDLITAMVMCYKDDKNLKNKIVEIQKILGVK